MTAVAHLASGLFLKARFPKAPLLWLLVAAEAADLVWVALNLFHVAGAPTLEVARVRQPFTYIGDLLLLEQPYSHSLAANVLLAAAMAFAAHLAVRKTGAPAASVALPVFLAVTGHWLLDFLVHDADLALLPVSGVERVGPAMSLNPADPARGLASTHPLVSWGAQTLLVVACVAAFLTAYPTTRKRRWGLYLALLVLSLLPAPTFLRGFGDGTPSTTSGMVLLTLVDLGLGLVLLYTLISRWTHPDLRPRYGPYAPELAQLLRGAQSLAAGLALALAAAYVTQAMLDSQRGPPVGPWSIALAAVYGCLAAGLLGRSLSVWWLAVVIPLLAGPAVRLIQPPGTLGLLHIGLEVALALVAAVSIRRMLTSRLML